jgi:hypothetical protein
MGGCPMGMAEFLKKKFLNKEICIYIGKEVETLTYEQSWAQNKEYFRGKLISIDEGVIELYISGAGTVYINSESIDTVWEPTFHYASAVEASLTKKPLSSKFLQRK